MSATKTLIVDDNADLRQRVREVLALEPGIAVVGEATDGREALRQARQLEPDLILMDVRMPGMNGLDATRQLRSEMPQIQVIILTTYDLEEYRKAVALSGAVGYVVKRSMVNALLPMIKEVCWGQEQRYSIPV
jgi:DNA-binding NarL/FixJ family response regulator